MILYDLATVIRSKNAGPFTLTIDLIFPSVADVDRALRAPGMTPEAIAGLYAVDPDQVSIHCLRSACAVKVTLPRRISSGAPGDTDVYGSQQHMALARLEIPDRPGSRDDRGTSGSNAG